MGKMTHYHGDFFHVADYGAVGDGVSDDTDAILAATDAAKPLRGIVLFPPGRFLLGGSSAHPRIRGAGLTLRGSGRRSSTIVFGGGRNTGMSLEGDHIAVEHLGFEGDSITQGLLIEWGSTDRNYNVIRDCLFRNGTGVSVWVSGGGKRGTTIADNVFENVYQAVALIYDNYFTSVLDNVVTGWKYSGIRLTGPSNNQQHSEHVLIRGNRLFAPDESGGPGSVGYPIHTEGLGGMHRNVVVDGNHVRGTDKEWGSDTGTPDQLSFNNVEGLVVSNNVSIDGGDMGITLEPSVSDFSVTGNRLFNNDVAGIYCAGNNGSIVGNVCRGNGVDRAGNVPNELRVGIYRPFDADNVLVLGNLE